jgi:hypothetical protein
MGHDPRVATRGGHGLVVAGALLVLALGPVAAPGPAAGAAPEGLPVVTVSTDPYTNPTSYHRTEVEADTFSSGSTIVAAFQAGRFFGPAASNNGWATTTDGGATWTHGFLPNLTVYGSPAGPWDRVSDPVVAYDRKHDVWMIQSLAMTEVGSEVIGKGVVVSRSLDGGRSWNKPRKVRAATGSSDFDKNWFVCDNWRASPMYGNCYAVWNDVGLSDRMAVSRSTDGGKTWVVLTAPATASTGAQPLVQPSGTLVIPIDTVTQSQLLSFVSSNAGASFQGPYVVATIQQHDPAGGAVRSSALPSADVDANGRVYVVWQDCRFRTSCLRNDIVMSTSTNGSGWSAPVRVPIDPTSSTVDHFLPGIGVERGRAGDPVRVGLVYHSFPSSACTEATCQLFVNFVSSADGGATWGSPVQAAGPMTLTWLPDTYAGRMVGDYVSTSWVGGVPYSVFARATAGSCVLGQVTSCHEDMVAPVGGFPVMAGSPVGPA